MARRAGSGTHYEYQDENGDTFWLPSVTTILHRVFGMSPFLIPWAYKLGLEGGESPEEFRDRRAIEGTATHDFAENVIKGTARDPENGYDEAFLRFVKEKEPFFLASEVEVQSFKSGYAGTLDFIQVVDGKPRIVDIKTKAKTVYKAYESELIQCRAYAIAAQEMGLIDVQPDTAILILKLNGRYTYDVRSVSEALWYDTLNLYKRLEEEFA